MSLCLCTFSKVSEEEKFKIYITNNPVTDEASKSQIKLHFQKRLARGTNLRSAEARRVLDHASNLIIKLAQDSQENICHCS